MWLQVFLLSMFCFFPTKSQVRAPLENVCKQTISESGLWWARVHAGTGGCEVLDGNKEECGICGLSRYNDPGENLCRHLELLWKFNFFHGSLDKSRQYCMMMDHCKMSYAITRAQNKQEAEGKMKTNFVNYICGTENKDGRREQRGECKSVYGTYICKCKHPYQGRDCNDIGPEGAYASGVQVLVDTQVRVSEPLIILIAVRNKGYDLKVLVNLIQFNALVTITKSKIDDPSSKKLISFCNKYIESLDYERCSNYLQKSTSMYIINVRFPLVRDNDYVWYYRSRIIYPIGYFTNFTVTTTNTINGVEKESFSRTNYDNTYNVFVEYPTDLGCYYPVRIINCKELQEKVNIYDASTYIVLHGDSPSTFIHEIHRIPCTSYGFESIQWSISQVMPDGTFLTIYELTPNNNYEFIIKPYSFINSMYVVKFSYTTESLGAPRHNFDQCFFKVVEASPIAIIDGGSSRYVDVDTGILLDGSRSYDPNFQGKKSKEGLHFEWSCIVSQTGKACLEDHLSPKLGSRDKIQLPTSIMEAQKEYVIKLTVRKNNKKPGYRSQTLFTGSMKSIQSIGLICVNCIEGNIANPTDFIYLLVKIGLKPNASIEYPLNFTWTYSIHPSYPPTSSVESLIVQGTSQDLLKIDKNKLEQKKSYCFRAAIQENDKFALAEYDIDILDWNNFTCSLSPESGVVAATNFSLNCPNITGITYETFDKVQSDTEENYSGRMMFTDFDNRNDNNFKLANGKVVVYGYNRYKMVQVWAHEVNLNPFDGQLKEMEDMVLQLEHSKIYTQRLLHSASVIPGALKPEMNLFSTDLFKSLISLVSTYQVDLGQMRLIKLVLSSLEFILVEMFQHYNGTAFHLEVEEARMCADSIFALASSLFEKVKTFNYEATLSENILHQMIKSHLNVIEIVFTVKNSEVLSTPLHLINPYVLHSVKETTYALVDALYKTSSSLLWRQIQGDSATEIVSSGSNITKWAMVHHPKVLYSLRRQNQNIPINFSAGFYQIMKNLDVLGLQVTNLNFNPFWWAGGDINTHILLVDTCFKVNPTECKYQRTFYKAPIYLYFNISHIYKSIEQFEIYTVYLNFSKGPHDLDLDVTVYRFDPPMRAKLYIQFEFENSTDNYKVMFSNERPGVEEMRKSGITINNKNQSAIKSIKYIRDDNDDRHYYMGIFPMQEGDGRKRAKFKVKIISMVCKTWLSWKWGNERCWVGEPETDESTLRCDCSHLSMFAGAVQVPKHSLNPAMEFILFLTEEFNWVPLVVLYTIIAVLIFLYIWGWRKDKQDSLRGIVTVLEDNYPGDTYGYLLGVYTGSRMNSSTDSHVGVKVFGRNGVSRAHILKNNYSPILRGNCDDWFLLYTLEHLGTLEKLHIWHDNSGSSPDWFVEKIEVYDLKEKFQYIFEMNVWLTMGVNAFPEMVVATASIDDFYSVRRVIQSNIVAGLRDTNYWTSIFWKHPRHPVKRTHRISVVVCYIMIAIICSVLIYYFNKGEEYREDEPEYNLTYTDFLIFIITLFVASFPTCLVMLLFRKSFSYRYVRMQSSLFLRPGTTGTKSVLFNLKSNKIDSNESQRRKTKFSTFAMADTRKTRFVEISDTNVDKSYIAFGLRDTPTERTFYEHLAFAVHRFVRHGCLEPVRLKKYRSEEILHKKYLVTAWVLLVIFVIAASHVVVLFVHRIPKIECEKWVTVFLCVLLFDALILSNLKILLCSIILGFGFQRLVPANNYRIKPEDGRKKRLVDDLDHLHELVQIRTNPMYCPLKGQLKEKFRLQCLRRKQWKTFSNFFVVYLLICVLVKLLSILTGSAYTSNAHVARMLTEGPSFKQENFSIIYNSTMYSNFLVNKFQDKLHRVVGFNHREDLFTEEDHTTRRSWTSDCTTRLLGKARIRQLRVILGACSKVKYFENLTDLCSPPWSSWVEDTGVYSSRWDVGKSEDMTRKSTAWRYTDPEISNSSESFGTTLVLYPSGGFIADLGFVKEDMEYAFSSLFPQNWLDHTTRAVFVELTLYNVNTKLYIQVVIVAEQMPTGEYLVVVNTESVTTDFKFDDFWRNNFFMVSFVVLLMFFLLRLCLLINRRGLFVHFSKMINVIEAVLLSLGFLAVFLYARHVKSSTDYVTEFQGSGMDTFFNFTNFSYIDWTRNVLLVLLVCVFFRLFLSWRFGRIYFSFYYTLVLSTSWIVWLVPYFILCLSVTQRMFGFLLNLFVFPYKTYLILFYKSPYVGGCEGVHYKVLVYFMCLLSYVVISLSIASFAYYYKWARIYKLLVTDNLNFFTFIKQRIFKSIFPKYKINRNMSSV